MHESLACFWLQFPAVWRHSIAVWAQGVRPLDRPDRPIPPLVRLEGFDDFQPWESVAILDTSITKLVEEARHPSRNASMSLGGFSQASGGGWVNCLGQAFCNHKISQFGWSILGHDHLYHTILTMKDGSAFGREAILVTMIGWFGVNLIIQSCVDSWGLLVCLRVRSRRLSSPYLAGYFKCSL